jgi:hypothetical protein
MVGTSNVSTTLSHYIKTASEDAKRAMQKLDSALNATNVTPKQPVPISRTVM